jgi:PEP-CTERM motif
MIAAVVLLGVGTPARASLVINPTFGTAITGDADAAAIEGAINAAIGTIESDITSPNSLSVSVYFNEMSSGLGESETGIYNVSYFSWYNAFKAVATAPDQMTALASLGPAPTSASSGNPVNGNTDLQITSAEGRNLGFNTPPVVSIGGGTYDGEVLLNTSLTSPPNALPGYYGLESVAMHEIDEVLGIGGTGSTIGNGATAPVGDLDLYRYSASGVRSYSTTQTTSPFAYFSIDGGATVLSYFNQTSGADYADWLSNPIPMGFSTQVQDAFATPGTNPTLGVNEITAFNAIGYRSVSAVPEPSTLLLAGLALALGYGAVRCRRVLARGEERP